MKLSLYLGLKSGLRLLSKGRGASVLADEQVLETAWRRLHSSVNITKAVELYTAKMVKMSNFMLCMFWHVHTHMHTHPRLRNQKCHCIWQVQRQKEGQDNEGGTKSHLYCSGIYPSSATVSVGHTGK